MDSNLTSCRSTHSPISIGPKPVSPPRRCAILPTVLIACGLSTPALAAPATEQSLNGWLVLGLITAVLLAGLVFQSARGRMR